jgi:hypothetical protein
VDYESLPLLGSPLEHVETYVYFDGPQTFALRSKSMPDLYYVVNTVDESDDDSSVTALAVAMNGDRFRAVRSGTVPFRDTFAGAAPFSLYSIVWSFDSEGAPEVKVDPRRPSELPAPWLPAPTARLRMPTATVEPFVSNELVSLSEAQGRTIFAVEVETPDSRITGFPGRAAGELQAAIDGEVVALTKEIADYERSPHRREVRSSVLGMRAASFVVIMGIDSVGTLVEATDVTSKVFARLNKLLESVREGDSAFLEEMKTHGSTVRNRFHDMLKAAASAQSGLAVTTVVAHTRDVVRASASPERVRSAVAAVASVDPNIDYINVPRGILTGFFLRRQRFEIVDAANPATIYKGGVTATAKAQADGLRVGNESFVSARLRVEVPFTSEDDSVGTKYVLVDIRPFDPEASGGQAPSLTLV